VVVEDTHQLEAANLDVVRAANDVMAAERNLERLNKTP
jgi:hypothetical protein